jgi:hypothetical protein
MQDQVMQRYYEQAPTAKKKMDKLLNGMCSKCECAWKKLPRHTSGVENLLELAIIII